MMTYEKVLRNLRFEHAEKMTKRHHPKLCRQKPCQTVWLIAFLESHPPHEAEPVVAEESHSEGIDKLPTLV